MFKVSQLFQRKFKPGASNVTDISGEKMIDLHIPLRDMAQSELKPEVRLRTHRSPWELMRGLHHLSLYPLWAKRTTKISIPSKRHF